MSHIMIERADMSMLSALSDLSAQLGYVMPQDQLGKQLEKILQRPDHQIYVALLDGAVCGWAHFYIVDLIISPRYIEIAGIIVDAAYRQHGIGRALLQQAETWALSQDVQLLYLRSNVKRKGAHIFYENLGYECIKQQKTFMKVIPAPA